MDLRIEQINQVKKVYEEGLFSKANVVGVAVGFKVVSGEETNELSIVVDVSQKVGESELAEQDIVPKVLDGIKTDVVEVGLIQALTGPTEKYRPAPGGVSIGHKDITAGTLGISIPYQTFSLFKPGESYCSVFGLAIVWPLPSTKKIYILSNNHVLANSNQAKIGDPVYQPGPYDGGGPDDTIAQLSAFVPIKFGGETNKVDCALAEPLNLSDVVERKILEIGEVSGVVEARLDMKVRKYGRTTKLTENVVTQIHATVDVGGYPGGKIARFEDQIITKVMASGGDSGSLLVEKNGQKAVGLLFAGSNRVTVFNCITNVEEALGIKI